MAIRVKTLKPTEDDVQRVVVEGLSALRYVVTVISRRRKRCSSCGAWSAGGDGVSKGAPDLLVRHPDWPRGMHVAMEVKKPGKVKWSSPEQQLAHEAGDTWLVQSLDDALRAIEAVALGAGLCMNRWAPL